MNRYPIFALFALLTTLLRAETEPIAWQPWSPEIFAQAKRENKFVLLDLEAVWCHWCHVMAGTTYRDPTVVGLFKQRYLAVRVDQDSRPDIANRYEDYGWPATVIFAPDGSELVKRRGYLPPRAMAALLQAVIDDPTPGPSITPESTPVAASSTALGDARRTALLAQWRDGYDRAHGGWGTSHKFLDGDNVELAQRLAARGDAEAKTFASETLRQERHLFDPVWGGVYQYSVGGDWHEPHFEKIMSVQAENLRRYTAAYAQTGDETDLAAARSIHRYLRDFLTSPDGVVYTSQDADVVPGEHSADYFALSDASRRARGIPRIDRHVYARENGWVIVALCELAAVTGDDEYRAEAVRAARWVIAHRALERGGFCHDERDAAGPYLGDTLAMGRAFLALHDVTQDREWLDRAHDAARFIGVHYSTATAPGFVSSDPAVNRFPLPRPEFDENVGVARFATALAHATGDDAVRALADSALRWLLATGMAEQRGAYLGGLLLAEEEARHDPAHIVIVGRKDDPTARAMFAAALRTATTPKLIEWWDRREGPAPRGEDIYPVLERSAAFVCSNGACSTPMFNLAALQARLAKLAR